MIKKTITVGEVKNLLKDGKRIKVKTLNGEYTTITDFIDKGFLDTFEVTLENGISIKVSKDHKFFTNVGWLECKNVIPEKHSILCDDIDKLYNKVVSIKLIGKHKIVDITVDHPEHCYFGNGMLNHNSGKSLICAHILAATQKMGGYGVLIDTENAAAPEFWSAVGLDIKNLGYVPLNTVEQIFSKIEEIIGIVRKFDKKQLVTIVVDSLSQASSETEMESEHGKDGYNTSKAIIISKACRKITGLIGQQRILVVFVNQLRMNLAAVGHQEKWIVPGGKAMAFAASVRLRLSNMGKLKGSGQKIIGNSCKVVVTKNRMGPPHRNAIFEIHYDSGIQDLTSWLDFLKDNGFARKDENKYSIKLPNETIKLSTKEFLEKIQNEQQFKDEIYDIISTDYIMKYRPANSQIIENLEVGEVEDDE